MLLSTVKKHLQQATNVHFKVQHAQDVPPHFHVTEIGLITKSFIDCGGKLRNEIKVNFQLWNANDIEHRITPAKLLHIIELSQKTLHIEDGEVEVEYQTETIGKYGLDFDGTHFILTTKQTACLAMENCGIDALKENKFIKNIVEKATACCTPGGGCC
jgi:hypothetical protein